MKIDIITLFPELFAPFLEWSMIKKAREIKSLQIKVHNLHDWGMDKRGTVDDRPYGGSPGMVLMIEPVYKALRDLKKKNSQVILLSAKGKTFNQKTAQNLSLEKHLIFLCGHYEGVDERIRKHLIDKDISIGNYVLSGGEIPAMTVVDSISRLLPKVLQKEGASEIESFSPGLKKLLRKIKRPQPSKKEFLIEFPHYTRPENFKGWKVPKVLLSGNHKEIETWRAEKIKKINK